MNSKTTTVPFFRRGDIGGISYAVTNNIVNYLIVIATLTGVLGWPGDIVFGYVVPAMSIGLMLGCFYYAYMGYKLSKKEGRADVTALPSGVSTPAKFVNLYGVIMPLSYAIEDPRLAWSAAMAACFIGGFVEFCGGFIGPWMKKRIPRAALLGTHIPTHSPKTLRLDPAPWTHPARADSQGLDSSLIPPLSLDASGSGSHC